MVLQISLSTDYVETTYCVDGFLVLTWLVHCRKISLDILIEEV